MQCRPQITYGRKPNKPAKQTRLRAGKKEKKSGKERGNRIKEETNGKRGKRNAGGGGVGKRYPHGRTTLLYSKINKPGRQKTMATPTQRRQQQLYWTPNVNTTHLSYDQASNNSGGKERHPSHKDTRTYSCELL